MATIDNISQGTTGHPARQFRKDAYVLKGTLNYASATTTKASALANSDLVQIIQIPAGTLVLGTFVNCLTSVTGATTTELAIGWSTNANALITSIAAQTLGYRATLTSSIPTLFTTATAVEVKITSTNGVPTAGTMDVGLVCVDAS